LAPPLEVQKQNNKKKGKKKETTERKTKKREKLGKTRKNGAQKRA